MKNRIYFGLVRRASKNRPESVLTFYDTREEAETFRERLGANYFIAEVNETGERIELYLK